MLYAFDPGARGKIPVERFKEAAEKFGWIVVGSNNSRNGALPPSVDAWNAIVKDTHARFAIDDGRVYVTGFSGGARLAIYFASHCSDCVAGVIACSAGFPSGATPAPSWHFALFGTAGIEDFNFAEVKGIEGPLARAGMTLQIEVFAGRHEWLPGSVAIEAVEWMELQAMKTGKRPRAPNQIESIWQSKLREAQALEDAGKTYDAYRIYLGLTETFKYLRDVVESEKKLSQLRDNLKVRAAIRDEQEQIRKQREIESRVSALLESRERSNAERTDEGVDPAVRLHEMFTELRKQAGQSEDTGERRVARRVVDGVFIGLFEQGLDQLQNQKRYAAAIRTFAWATEVNPERAGSYFYLAWGYAAKGDKKRAVLALQTAADKGFSDFSAITSNEAFDPVRNDAQYRQIIQAMQSKH